MRDLAEKAHKIIDKTAASRGVHPDPDNVIRRSEMNDLVYKNVIDHD